MTENTSNTEVAVAEITEEVDVVKSLEGFVDVNIDAVEPNEYFRVLKDSKKQIDQEALQSQLNMVANYVSKAKAIGQTSLLDKLAFTYATIVKEQALLVSGLDKFVYQSDVEKFLDKTKHIKIIELDRYPRVIPMENLDAISKAKDLEIFDSFVVVFTDLSDDDYKTEEEKKFVARNRDPIVFGHFHNDRSGIKHDRLYFITDWEDEYCDLTFGKMIEKMAEVGIANAEHTIASDDEYIKEIVNATLENMNVKKGSIGVFSVPSHNVVFSNKSFWSRFKSWVSKK